MYADDTAIICTHESMTEASCAANEEMRIIYNWFHANKLLPNIKKTTYMVMHSFYKVITLDSCVLQAEGEPTERVSNLTYLGVVLNHHFNKKMHIDCPHKKLSTVCFMLFKCHHFLDASTLRTIYFALFQSQLSYCIKYIQYTIYNKYIV